MKREYSEDRDTDVSSSSSSSATDEERLDLTFACFVGTIKILLMIALGQSCYDIMTSR